MEKQKEICEHELQIIHDAPLFQCVRCKDIFGVKVIETAKEKPKRIFERVDFEN